MYTLRELHVDANKSLSHLWLKFLYVCPLMNTELNNVNSFNSLQQLPLIGRRNSLFFAKGHMKCSQPARDNITLNSWIFWLGVHKKELCYQTKIYTICIYYRINTVGGDNPAIYIEADFQSIEYQRNLNVITLAGSFS